MCRAHFILTVHPLYVHIDNATNSILVLHYHLGSHAPHSTHATSALLLPTLHSVSETTETFGSCQHHYA